jgi:hypothetical protein
LAVSGSPSSCIKSIYPSQSSFGLFSSVLPR